jgi:toxin ParE1/3/4
VAEIVWTLRALASLDEIAGFIALDNPEAAKELGKRLVGRVEQLKKFPLLGPKLPEAPRMPHRHLVISPCRVLYRADRKYVTILYVMRGEQEFNRHFVEPTDR